MPAYRRKTCRHCTRRCRSSRLASDSKGVTTCGPFSSIIISSMTVDEARQIVVEGINYAAYKETDSSLYDSDKNRLFGSEHYKSGRHEVKPSPWSDGDFEEKMSMLLGWASALNRSNPVFEQAQSLLEAEDSVIGRVIRRANVNDMTPLEPQEKE